MSEEVNKKETKIAKQEKTQELSDERLDGVAGGTGTDRVELQTLSNARTTTGFPRYEDLKLEVGLSMTD
jgi:hypothetical protein